MYLCFVGCARAPSLFGRSVAGDEGSEGGRAAPGVRHPLRPARLPGEALQGGKHFFCFCFCFRSLFSNMFFSRVNFRISTCFFPVIFVDERFIISTVRFFGLLQLSRKTRWVCVVWRLFFVSKYEVG